MKKDIRTIVILLVLIVLLCGGIFFVVKSDVFSSKKETIVENNNQNNEETNENQEENKTEEVENQEKEGTEEKKEESKKEEPKKEETKEFPEAPKKETPSVNKTEVNIIKPTDDNKKNESTEDTNIQTPSQEPVKPNIPNGGTLTCRYVQYNDEAVISETVVGVFDTTDGYIRSYKDTMVIDFSETYEPFEEDLRLELEIYFKNVAIESFGSEISAYTVTSNSHGNIINIYLESDYARLKGMYPEEFSSTGHFYYNNFKTFYASEGYTCS